MIAPTPLLATMQTLAREEWKENAFPIIKNGKLVEWNRYYFDEGALLLRIFQAKGEGLDPKEIDILHKKTKEAVSNKITGKSILNRVFSKDDRKTMKAAQKIFFKNLPTPTEAFVFPKSCEATIVKHSPYFEQALKDHSGEVETKDISKADNDYLLSLSRLPVVEGQIKEVPTRKINVANGEVIELPDYYVQALCQDSQVLDHLFSSSDHDIQLLDVSKDELNLLIMYAYEKDTDRHSYLFNREKLLMVAHLALKLKMEGVLVDIKYRFFYSIGGFENMKQFELALRLYPLFCGERDGEVRIALSEYFSSAVSRCSTLGEFKHALEKLREIHLISFKLYPQKDGWDDARAEALIELIPDLESLDLSCVRDLNPRAIDKIGQMKKLVWLFLNGCCRMDDAALKKISNVETLTNLVIAGDLLTDEGLSHLINLQSLVQIVIWGPSSITDKGITVFDHMKSLHTLRLHDCKHVTTEALKVLNVPHISEKFL